MTFSRTSRRQFLREYLLHQHELGGRPENRLVSFDVWWIGDRSPAPGEKQGEPLAPEKLLSYGHVADSGADAVYGPLQARRRTGEHVPLHGP